MGSPLAAVAALLLATSLRAEPAAALPPAAASSSSDAGVDGAPPLSAAGLDGLLADLASTDATVRVRGARSLASLGPGGSQAAIARLTEMRNAPAAGRRRVANALRAAEKDARARSLDFVETLAATPPEDTAITEALTAACLTRSLGHATDAPALSYLVGLAAAYDGALSAELARILKVVDERAIPALVRARGGSSQAARLFAVSELDALGRRTAADAVQLRDRDLLADVLRAFGEVKDLEALPVVLSFVASDHAALRSTARSAVLAYEGDALFKLREAYAALAGKPPEEGWTATDVARQLFALHDEARLREANATLDQGLAEAAAGRTDAALALFDRLLADAPTLPRRAETAPVFVTRAQALVDDDPVAATALARKAALLDPTGHAGASARSILAYLDGRRLIEGGLNDREPFRRALDLDPENAKARSALALLEAEASTRQARLGRGLAALGAGLSATFAVVLFIQLRRRPASSRRRAR